MKLISTVSLGFSRLHLSKNQLTVWSRQTTGIVSGSPQVLVAMEMMASASARRALCAAGLMSSLSSHFTTVASGTPVKRSIPFGMSALGLTCRHCQTSLASQESLFLAGSPVKGYAVEPRQSQAYRKFASAAFRPKAAKKSSGGNGMSGEEGDDRMKKLLALEAAMADINATFGKGSVIRLGSAGGNLIETFPSGNLALDVALGGGLPKGRIVEIYGPESSGKTTLALHAIAEVQKTGGHALLIDAEHAFDEVYASSLGVNTEDLILIQPDSGEMALESADKLIRSKAMGIICVDSVSALVPRAELEGDIGQPQIGLQARLMSASLRKLAANASKGGCTLIFLNQIRFKIGVFYGSPETTSGGNALKFFASLRLDVRQAGKIKSPKGDDVGIRCRVKIVKSKVSRPFRQAEFDIMFGNGISRLGCIADCAESLGLVVKKGAWYSFNETKLGQGKDKVLQFLQDNPEIADDLEKQIRESITEETRRLREGPRSANGGYAAALVPAGVASGGEEGEEVGDSEESDVE